jgi:xanthine dehydrogenase YagS FAD-binding subunit
MHPFTYVAVTKQGEAIERLGRNAEARFLAGGTNLVDEMKLGIQRPRQLIDVNGLPLAKIEEAPGGALRIGAMVRNSDLAYDARIRELVTFASAVLAGPGL